MHIIDCRGRSIRMVTVSAEFTATIHTACWRC